VRRILGTHLPKDLRMLFADPWALLLSLSIPLVLGGLMSLAFGGAGDVQPEATVYLADEDGSLISELLVNALASEGVPVHLIQADWETCRAALEAGDGSVAIRFPANLGQRLLLEEPVTLDVVTNPAQTVLPGIVTGFLELFREGHFYLHRLFGGPLRLIAGAPPEGSTLFENAQVAALSIQINGLIQDVEGRLFPPQVQLATVPPDEQRAFDRPLSQLLLPGVLVMALMFLAQGFAEQMWREREVPTLRRVATTPWGITELIASKTLSATLMLAGILAICIMLGALAFDLPSAGLFSAWLLATFAGSAFYLLFGFIGSFASNQRGANILTSMLLFPLLMIGGSFLPLETMPHTFAALGRATPNGSVVEALSALLGGAEVDWFLPLTACAVTCLVGAFGFVWDVRRGLKS